MYVSYIGYQKRKDHFYEKILFSLLTFALILLTFGCNKAVYVLSVPKQPTEFFDKNIPSEKTFDIGGKTISLVYKHSKKVGVFQYDSYFTQDNKSYRFDQDGNLTFISDNELFPAVENIENLSEEQIKDAVISRLSDIFDFSVYDTFTFHKNLAHGLRWEVSDKMISLEVMVDQTGEIDYISIQNCCPDEKPLIIDDKTRDKLLKRAIAKDVKGDFTFEIVSEKQTFDDQGRNAISYVVSVTDKAGFSHGVFIYLIA